MSSYEANWETGLVVTAEAVFGIGLPPTADQETKQEPSAPSAGGPHSTSIADDVSD